MNGVDWFVKAADKGNSHSKYFLALSYTNGWCVEKDLKKAFELNEESALLGHCMAMYMLAKCYQDGSGVVQDVSKAKEWYVKAANQDNLLARDALHSLSNGVDIVNNVEFETE